MTFQLEQTVNLLSTQFGITLTKQQTKAMTHYAKGQNSDYQLEHMLYQDSDVKPTAHIEKLVVKKGEDTWTATIQNYANYSVCTLKYEGNRADAEQNKQKIKQMMPTITSELFPFAAELLKAFHLVTDPAFLQREQELRGNLPQNDYVSAGCEITLETVKQLPQFVKYFIE